MYIVLETANSLWRGPHLLNVYCSGGGWRFRLSLRVGTLPTSYSLGAGIVQWLERRTRDWKVAGSSPGKSGGRSFFSRVNFLCWLLFRYPFHPRKSPGRYSESTGGWLQLNTHALAFVSFCCLWLLTIICHLAKVNVYHCVIILSSAGNPQISKLLSCFLYLFAEFMITM